MRKINRMLSLFFLIILITSTPVVNSTFPLTISLNKEIWDVKPIVESAERVNEKHANSAISNVNRELSVTSFFGKNTDMWSPNIIDAWKQSSFMDNNSIRLIIGVNNDLFGAYEKILQEISAKNGEVVNTIKINNEPIAVVVDFPSSEVSSTIRDFLDNGLARYVEPDMKVELAFTPNDPGWSSQWGPIQIEADKAWDKTLGNNSILVAVLDTGVDYTHADIKDNYVDLGYDWVNNDDDPMDDHWHGTHCAGIIAAVINNSIGIAGLAQVSIMAEKVLTSDGFGYWDWIASAIIDATDKGADIISMSLGGYEYSHLVHEAVQYAYSKGVLLVAAAGNDNWNAKFYPAAYDEVIAVSATDQFDQKAYFSNYGDWIELAAPGVSIYSTVPGGYAYASGTSMACPHVAGLAALVMSYFPNKTNEWVRLWLRYTADDLGELGFDEIYGFGRINARKALEEPPLHEIMIINWEKPYYSEPYSTNLINATILNFGRSQEKNVTVQLFVNCTMISNVTIGTIESGQFETVSMQWIPTKEGKYNVTIRIVPIENEENYENNVIQGYIYVGYPVKAYVISSSSGYLATSTWDTLNEYWPNFGDQLIYIDYETLCKDKITYDDLNATKADVLIISSLFDREFTDEEIEAIKRYVLEGHGLIATALTFNPMVPNNSKLAPLFGLNRSVAWTVTQTDMLNIFKPEHPLFSNISNPYIFPTVNTAVPSSGKWDSKVIVDGEYLALGYFNESAIVVKNGLLYISPFLESLPIRYKFHLQLFYNAILWSRYQKPEHDLCADLEVTRFLHLGKSTTINASVTNVGLNCEENVTLTLFINKEVKKNVIIPLLKINEKYTLSFFWESPPEGVYNITAYVHPVFNESEIDNNIVTIMVMVAEPLIEPKEGDWAFYKMKIYRQNQQENVYFVNITYSKYITPYEVNVTFTYQEIDYPSTWMRLNIFTRWAEDPRGYGMWYPGWIEKNVTIGSKINLLYGPATINMSKIINLKEIYPIDCWGTRVQVFEGSFNCYYYDKITGLWIKGEYESSEVILLETNIFDIVRYEHELALSLDAPEFMELRKTYLLNATVINAGKNNESNVIVNIYINGSLVNTTTISNLKVGETFSLYYDWTPSLEATYNITAYAKPLQNENLTANNVKTVIVEVKAIKGKILVDQTHYTDDISLFSCWINELEKRGYLVEINTVYPINSTILNEYDVLVIPQAHSRYLLKEIRAIKEFVNGGGGLLVLGDDSPQVYTELTSFAGLSWKTDVILEGETTNIEVHEVTANVSRVYIPYSLAAIIAAEPSKSIVRSSTGRTILGVYSKIGRVACFVNIEAFMDGTINSADNLQLAINIIVWLVKNDCSPPEIDIISPENEAYVGSKSINVEWTAFDSESGVVAYDIYLNDRFVTRTNLTHYTLSNLTQGLNKVTVIAYDFFSNNASDSVIFYVDLGNPEIEIISPASGLLINRTKVLVKWAGNDNESGVDHYSIYVNGVQLDQVYFNVTEYLVYGLVEGENNITITVCDKAGNLAFDSITVLVDLTPPTVSLVSPTNGSYVRAIVVINCSVTDNFGIENVKALVDGTEIPIYTSSNETYKFLWNTTTFSNNQSNVSVIAKDLAGNKKIVQITVTVDNIPPTLGILEPEKEFLKSISHIKVYAMDNNAVQNVTLLINDEQVAMWKQTGVFVYEWNLPLENGVYHLRLLAFDIAGNSFEESLSITIDNERPEVIIHSPTEGSKLSGTAYINFSVSDENLASILLYIDNSVFNVTNRNYYEWNTLTVADGNHIIRIVAIDKAGNMFEASVMVEVANYWRQHQFDFTLGMGLGSLVTAGIMALIFITILKRKH